MKLNELVLYENIGSDPIVRSYETFINSNTQEAMRQNYFQLTKKLLNIGKTLESHFFGLMIATDNVILERMTHKDYAPTDLDKACLRNDLSILDRIINGNSEEQIASASDDHGLLTSMLTLSSGPAALMAYRDFFDDEQLASQRCDAFIELLKRYGTGEFAVNPAYYINHDNQLVPVEHFKPLSWDHIYDYPTQKEKLLENTKALVEGRAYHHALLVGASGTGKSSSVKGVIDMYKDQNLRLIQLYKGQMQNLPWLLNKLASSAFKFVIFIDDLSFEVNEEHYKLLKSYIEGGVVNESSNIAFYVTSNRQHLIKEDRSDREGDIHIQDFIQEMTSLSRRFGLRLTYAKLQQKDYYDMVAKMLEDASIEFTREAMEQAAKRWSMRHSGMSGRIAAQFVREVQMRGGLE